MANHNKITIGRRSTQTSSKRVYLLFNILELLQYSISLKLKLDGNVIGEDEDLDVHKSHKAGLMSSHTLELVTVVVFDGRYDQPRGFVRFKRQAITLVETTLLLDEFEGLSVAHNFAVVRMITTSKDG